jgi:hypothetical protein
LPQNNLSAAVLTNNVERVLTDIDADNGNPGVLLRHGVLLVFGAPCQLQSLPGQEHGRTIPLTDIGTTGQRITKLINGLSIPPARKSGFVSSVRCYLLIK